MGKTICSAPRLRPDETCTFDSFVSDEFLLGCGVFGLQSIGRESTYGGHGHSPIRNGSGVSTCRLAVVPRAGPARVGPDQDVRAWAHALRPGSAIAGLWESIG